jgi:hypothetical protein
MNEVEWLTSADARRMLESCRPDSQPERSLITDRKLHLFTLAVFRSAQPHDRGHERLALEWEEAGLVPDQEMRLPFWINGERWHHVTDPADLLRDIVGNPFRPIRLAPGPEVQCHICDGMGGELVPTYRSSSVLTHCGRPTQTRFDIAYIRDAQPPRWCSVCWATFLPEHTGYRVDKLCTCCKGEKKVEGPCPWLTWEGAKVVQIAREMYESRDFTGMPVLADALEDAGCEDEAILTHCRGLRLCSGCSEPGRECSGWCAVCDRSTHEVCWVPNPQAVHVLGCWVLDLILGKE